MTSWGKEKLLKITEECEIFEECGEKSSSGIVTLKLIL